MILAHADIAGHKKNGNAKMNLLYGEDIEEYFESRMPALQGGFLDGVLFNASSGQTPTPVDRLSCVRTSQLCKKSNQTRTR